MKIGIGVVISICRFIDSCCGCSLICGEGFELLSNRTANLLNKADFLLKRSFASEFENRRQTNITTIWTERPGIPCFVLSMSFKKELTKKPKANMMFSFVKGMRLDMTICCPCPLVECLFPAGLIFLSLLFAIISAQIRHAVVKYASTAKGKAPSKSFSEPM